MVQYFQLLLIGINDYSFLTLLWRIVMQFRVVGGIRIDGLFFFKVKFFVGDKMFVR